MAKKSNVKTIGMPEHGPICDFCSSEAIVWLYPTEEDTVYMVVNEEEEATKAVSLPGFAACEVCAAPIEAGNRIALEERRPCDLRKIRRIKERLNISDKYFGSE